MDNVRRQDLNAEIGQSTLVCSIVQGVRYCFVVSDALTGILPWDEAIEASNRSRVIDIPAILEVMTSQDRPCLQFRIHEQSYLVFLGMNIEVLQLEHAIVEPFPAFLSGTAKRLGVRTMIEWKDQVCLLIDPELLSENHQG